MLLLGLDQRLPSGGRGDEMAGADQSAKDSEPETSQEKKNKRFMFLWGTKRLVSPWGIKELLPRPEEPQGGNHRLKPTGGNQEEDSSHSVYCASSQGWTDKRAVYLEIQYIYANQGR